MAEHNRLMRLVFGVFVAIFLVGCGTVRPTITEHQKQRDVLSHFKEKFFESWECDSGSSYDRDFEGLLAFADSGERYGENLMPVSEAKIKMLLQTAMDSKSNKIFKNGITLRNSDIRVLPTQKPLFRDPGIAGEGYPFDYLQNSRIYISTPIKVIYETANKDYFFIKSPVGYGWIDTRSVAFTNPVFENRFRTSILTTPLYDKKPLYDDAGFFVESLNIGSVLADGYYPFRDENGNAAWRRYAQNKYLRQMPMPMSESAVSFAAYSLNGEPYGWGGYLDNRDCSMFLRDIFVAFGLFLPRNSADQANGYVDIGGMEKALKKEYIKTHAKPWRTLVYLKGHIMLYVGVDASGEPLVMHDVWGIKSFDGGKEGRKMIGGVAITKMEEGKGEPWFDETKSSLLVKTLGIKDIF